MEKYLEYSNELIAELKVKHVNCDFRFNLIEEYVNISVFFVITGSIIISQNDLWQKISKDIALKYQSKLESTYEKWNMYIIYVTRDNCTKELKNKIENDKFSSRKIVEDSFDKEFSDHEADLLIVKHITNTDLKKIVDETQQVTVKKYIPKNEKLWEKLMDIEKVIGDRKAQEDFVQKINSL